MVDHRPENEVSILLVEDNEIDVEITKRVLARSGTAVTLRVARDGKEALDALFAGESSDAPPGGSTLPGLILLDLRLPVIDGTEVLRRVKNDPFVGAIPVAVLTGVSSERAMLECMALGGNMYFAKPITKAEAERLIPAIRNYWQVIATLREPRPRGQPGRRSAA